MKAKGKILRNTPQEEAAIQRGIDADPDTYELTGDEFAQLRPAGEVFSKKVLNGLRHGNVSIKHVSDAEYEATRQRGRPKSENPKVSVTMRLDAHVVKFFRSGGEGWQTRLNAFLAAHVKRASKVAIGKKAKPKI
jgi:uncharacterized protein (DUF4415 family)